MSFTPFIGENIHSAIIESQLCCDLFAHGNEVAVGFKPLSASAEFYIGAEIVVVYPLHGADIFSAD